MPTDDQGQGPRTPDAYRPVRVYWCRVCRRRGLPFWHRETEAVFVDHLSYQARYSMRAEAPSLGEVFARLVEEGE